jgi:hypothetical protein
MEGLKEQNIGVGWSVLGFSPQCEIRSPNWINALHNALRQRKMYVIDEKRGRLNLYRLY